MRKIYLFILPVVALVAVAGVYYLGFMGKTNEPVKSETVQITSIGVGYPAYVAAPGGDGRKPAVVLIHSFNGLEPGYKALVDRFAAEGFVVIAPEWQTFTRTPRDEVVMQLVTDSAAYLKGRSDVDGERLGLTGFCAGGRFTMLLLPQMAQFKSGVAWYGFPYSRGSNNQTQPADYMQQLSVPMLIIHGTADQASRIEDIYRYATALDGAGKYFEMKVYQAEPHGFMITGGALSQSFPAEDAYWQMATFFSRTLK